MKRVQIVLAALFIGLLAACERDVASEVPLSDLAASDLFFSEYVEGSSSNKALEVYNGTGVPVDLSSYSVEIYFNGNSSAGTTIDLIGVVADGDVFVLADDGADPAILAETDQTSTSNFFNGDDAIVLRNDGEVVDAFGRVGTDPGLQFGSGDTGSQNNTLRRAADTMSGDTDPNDAFDPATEYEGFGQDNFGDLGMFDGSDPAPSIVINEVDADTPGSDSAEFVELYDGGAGSTPLDGLVVVFFNGSDDASYEAFDLDGQTTDENGFFVLGNPDVANVDLVFDPGNSGALQNGADAGALYQGDASDFPNDTPVTTDNLVDAIVYDTDDGGDSGLLDGLGETTQFNEDANNDKDNESNARVPDGMGEFTAQAPTPGASNAGDGGNGGGDGGGEIGQCGTDATLISAVQGSGATSPLVGQTVVIEGVVVGDFQASDDGMFGDLDGFHVQEEVTDYDADEETSEGVFVFTGSSDVPDVQVGQTVRVRGTVGEFESSGSSQTQITDPTVVICSEGVLPPVTDITLPVPPRNFLERYEGMYVRFPQSLAISEYFNFDRFGEIVLARPLPGEDRPYQPTAVNEPGSEAAAERDEDNRLARITLDDGRSNQNPDPARHPNGEVFDLDNRFRGGDLVQNALGVLDNTFGIYRVQPTQGANYTRVNPRPEEPEAVGGSLKVASFNVLNYFNGDGQGGGFPTSRGADDPEEFQRQEAKIVASIVGTGADVVGLIEIENDPAGETSALDDLTEALNAEAGAGTYDYIRTGDIGTDEIKVAFIYKPGTVTPIGDPAVLTEFEGRDFVDPRDIGPKNRPALAQTFREEATGGVLTVVVNHFKSKGSSCGPGDDDPDQGNCNGTRADAADILVDWLASDPTGSGDPDVLVIGDLNAYDKEDPIDQVKEGADDADGTEDDYADLNLAFEGELAYSYVFSGQFGYLDYALANQALLDQVTGLTEWHINADEPDILDYDTTFKKDPQDALFEPNPYRSSDHDPVIVGLDLTPSDAEAPVITLKRSGQTLFPPNHKYRTLDLAQIIASVSDNVSDLSVSDVVITRVTSDEPENGTGDGNTDDDIVLEGCQVVELRAERSGPGDGRVYTVEIAVQDRAGNVGTASYRVEVPKGRKDAAIDSGTAYSVTGCELP